MAGEGLHVDVDDFLDYNAARDWRIGGAPIHDWKALARKWSRKEERGGPPDEADGTGTKAIKRNLTGHVWHGDIRNVLMRQVDSDNTVVIHDGILNTQNP